MNLPARHTRTVSCITIFAASLLGACDVGTAAQPDGSIRPAIRPISTSDTVIRAATRALEADRPWEATRLLAPLLRTPATRSSAAVLRAAEAASQWEGWNETVALLRDEPWLSKEYGGDGYVLLTRAMLSMKPQRSSTDSGALGNAQRALPLASNRAERGEREMLLALAHDRLRNADSARVHYLRAAQQLPEAGDWLLLRAAAITADARARQADYQKIRGLLPRERVEWTEAAARENSGDSTGAIAAYEKLGDQPSAFRLRLATASDAMARDAVRREMIALLGRTPLPVGARGIITVLDEGPSKTAAGTQAEFSDTDELIVARAANTVGLTSRAATAYARAFRASPGEDRDHFRYGELLFRLNRPREAAAQFARVSASSTLAGSASYQRARALLRAGDGTAATRLLNETRTKYRADTVAAASALYLLGDLASDASKDAEARRNFVELVRGYPTSSFAPQAALRAAIVAFMNGEPQQAARELDAFNAAVPSHSEALAARYWSARAWKQAGNDSAARSRWREVIQRSGSSYYAMLAARRLGEPVWTPATDSTPSLQRRFADIDSANNRARLLEHLMLTDEMRLEDERLVREAGTDVERIMATARGFADRGNSSRAIALARRALERNATQSVAVYRLLFPVAQEGVLRAEAKRSGVDPALLAALIRQESNFTPHATSVAGARGLMQLMPSVGASIARGAGIAPWDAVLLYQADVNVQLGVRHLSGSLRKYPQTGQALAAYNAGDSRVARWRTKAGGNDEELFVERIPFVETRDYVRIILRNRELYRSLYHWPER